MAPEEKAPQETKTLEMRIAAIEDKLGQLAVSEEEMRAYQKVASLMAGRAVGAGAAAQLPRLSPQICVITPVFNCIHCVFNCIRTIFPPIIVADCIPVSVTAAQIPSGGFGALGR